MRVIVALEHRFVSHGGDLYADAVVGYGFFQRYLAAFDDVTIVARAKEVDQVPGGWIKTTGERVDFVAMPYYQGFLEFLQRAISLWRAAGSVAKCDASFILRVSGTVGTFLWAHLLILNKPFALEVVGDPYDSLSPQVWGTWWITPIRLLSRYILRQQCKTARSGIIYVTKRALQRRYPPGPGLIGFGGLTGINSQGISDANLTKAAFCPRQDVHASKNRSAMLSPEYRVITVGTMASLYKGQSVLIEAISHCVRDGLDIELVLLGDGRYRPVLETLASKLQISDRVRFVGHISDQNTVYSYLRSADLFVLPSFQEGLPRAMLEAMASGLPCIGSTVGGIPELLPVEDLVPPGDAVSLASKIADVLTSEDRMSLMSARNAKLALEYREEILAEQRTSFYREMRDRTQELLKEKA